MNEVVLRAYEARASEYEMNGAKVAAAIIRDLIREIRRIRWLAHEAVQPN